MGKRILLLILKIVMILIILYFMLPMIVGYNLGK